VWLTRVLLRRVQALAEVCAVCNDARIEAKDGVFRAAGAATEAALVVLAEKLGVPDAGDQARIGAARAADPDAHADGASRWYHARRALRRRPCAPRAPPPRAPPGKARRAAPHAPLQTRPCKRSCEAAAGARRAGRALTCRLALRARQAAQGGDARI